LVKTPYWSNFLESAWLKIPLILSAIKSGYDWIFFVDADCEIRPHTPAIKTIAVAEQSLYMGLGFSGNVNSGVIIVKNTEDARLFFEQVLKASTIVVPETDLGENGHIIHFAKQYSSILKIIPSQWNNNADTQLNDYIRHYSAGGPMRSLFRFSLKAKLLRLCINLRSKIVKFSGANFTPRDELMKRLQRALYLCQKRYPEFILPHSNRKIRVSSPKTDNF
jgi:hypothetical protein